MWKTKKTKKTHWVNWKPKRTQKNRTVLKEPKKNRTKPNETQENPKKPDIDIDSDSDMDSDNDYEKEKVVHTTEKQPVLLAENIRRQKEMTFEEKREAALASLRNYQNG